MQALLDSFGDN